MAIFDNKKKDKKNPASPRLRRVRATKLLAEGIAHEVIRAPWFSEKALIVTEKGVYTFAVPTRVTKADIAGAIKEIYKVEPRKIRIVNLPAKRKARMLLAVGAFRPARMEAPFSSNAWSAAGKPKANSLANCTISSCPDRLTTSYSKCNLASFLVK